MSSIIKPILYAAKKQKRNSVIKIIDRNLPDDKDELKKELLKQIEEVKKATLL